MHWRLEGHEVVEVADLLEWARWFETTDRRVALDEIGGKRISTVFLGIDHNFTFHGPPVLFETMVFPLHELLEERCERYCTWDQAEAGHQRIVDELRLTKEEPE